MANKDAVSEGGDHHDRMGMGKSRYRFVHAFIWLIIMFVILWGTAVVIGFA